MTKGTGCDIWERRGRSCPPWKNDRYFDLIEFGSSGESFERWKLQKIIAASHGGSYLEARATAIQPRISNQQPLSLLVILCELIT